MDDELAPSKAAGAFSITVPALARMVLKANDQIDHYLHLLAHIMQPYCTSKGKNQITAFTNHQ